jgi:hypothetical protein
MPVTIPCPSCEAMIQLHGGRKSAVATCPWCGADMSAKPKPPAPAVELVPGDAAPVIEPTQPTTATTSPAGGSQPLLAAAILVLSTVLAVGAFFVARHLVRNPIVFLSSDLGPGSKSADLSILEPAEGRI